MSKKMMESLTLKEYFFNKAYKCLSPYPIGNSNDTVFITAGIQPILTDYRQKNILNAKKIYLSQPVIRTQFKDSISEGNSIAFTNLTLAGFNISQMEHDDLVKDCLELFCKLGLKPQKIEFKRKDYERNWGKLLVSGKKTFYYYNGIELGDTTFFTNVTENGEKIGINTMSDVGFGIERVRWCLNNNSYFDLYSNSDEIKSREKAYLSAIALLTVNDIKPSNKNSGYRTRMFSKKLVEELEGCELTVKMKKYLDECIEYWSDWQENNKTIDMNIINKEFIRNSNRYIIDKLINEGYKNIEGVNINVSRDEFIKRLSSSGLEKSKIDEIKSIKKENVAIPNKNYELDER